MSRDSEIGRNAACDRDTNEQDDEAEVQTHLPQSQRRDHLPQSSKRWVGRCVDDLCDEQYESMRPPVSGKHLNPVEDKPPDQEDQVQEEKERDNSPDQMHGTTVPENASTLVVERTCRGLFRRLGLSRHHDALG